MWFACRTPSWTIDKPNPINISCRPINVEGAEWPSAIESPQERKGEEKRGWLVNITLHGIDSECFISLLLVYPLSTSTFYRYLVFSQERHTLEKYANLDYGEKNFEKQMDPLIFRVNLMYHEHCFRTKLCLHEARQYLMPSLEFEELSCCREGYAITGRCSPRLHHHTPPSLWCFCWKWHHASETHSQRRTNERTRLGRGEKKRRSRQGSWE